jgi:hypothetical protein
MSVKNFDNVNYQEEILVNLLSQRYNPTLKYNGGGDPIEFVLVIEKAEQKITTLGLEDYIFKNKKPAHGKEPIFDEKDEEIHIRRVQLARQLGRHELVKNLESEWNSRKKAFNSQLKDWQALETMHKSTMKEVNDVFNDHFTPQALSIVQTQHLDVKDFAGAWNKIEDNMFRSPEIMRSKLEKLISNLVFLPQVCTVTDFHEIFTFLQRVLFRITREKISDEKIKTDMVLAIQAGTNRFDINLTIDRTAGSNLETILENMVTTERTLPSPLDMKRWWQNSNNYTPERRMDWNHNRKQNSRKSPRRRDPNLIPFPNEHARHMMNVQNRTPRRLRRNPASERNMNTNGGGFEVNQASHNKSSSRPQNGSNKSNRGKSSNSASHRDQDKSHGIVCWNCDQPGHYKSDCPHPLRQNTRDAYMVSEKKSKGNNSQRKTSSFGETFKERTVMFNQERNRNEVNLNGGRVNDIKSSSRSSNKSAGQRSASYYTERAYEPAVSSNSHSIGDVGYGMIYQSFMHSREFPIDKDDRDTVMERRKSTNLFHYDERRMEGNVPKVARTPQKNEQSNSKTTNAQKREVKPSSLESRSFTKVDESKSWVQVVSKKQSNKMFQPESAEEEEMFFESLRSLSEEMLKDMVKSGGISQEEYIKARSGPLSYHEFRNPLSKMRKEESALLRPPKRSVTKKRQEINRSSRDETYDQDDDGDNQDEITSVIDDDRDYEEDSNNQENNCEESDREVFYTPLDELEDVADVIMEDLIRINIEVDQSNYVMNEDLVAELTLGGQTRFELKRHVREIIISIVKQYERQMGEQMIIVQKLDKKKNKNSSLSRISSVTIRSQKSSDDHENDDADSHYRSVSEIPSVDLSRDQQSQMSKKQSSISSHQIPSESIIDTRSVAAQQRLSQLQKSKNQQDIFSRLISAPVIDDHSHDIIPSEHILLWRDMATRIKNSCVSSASVTVSGICRYLHESYWDYTNPIDETIYYSAKHETDTMNTINSIPQSSHHPTQSPIIHPPGPFTSASRRVETISMQDIFSSPVVTSSDHGVNPINPTNPNSQSFTVQQHESFLSDDQEKDFIFDVGATNTILSDSTLLNRGPDGQKGNGIKAGNFLLLAGKQLGKLLITNEGTAGELPNILVVPDTTKNLLNSWDLIQLGYDIRSQRHPNSYVIRNPDGEVVLTAIAGSDKLYHIKMSEFKEFIAAMHRKKKEREHEQLTGSSPMRSKFSHAHEPNKLLVLSRRFMHAPKNVLLSMTRNQAVHGLGFRPRDIEHHELPYDDSRMLGRMNAPSHQSSKTIHQVSKDAPSALIHTDPIGPFPKSRQGNVYALVILDDYSHKGFIYFMKKKSEVRDKLELYRLQHAGEHAEHPLLRMQSDSDALFKDQEVTAWALQHGITRQYSAPYIHEQNGKIERFIRTITDMTRTTMSMCNLHVSHWEDIMSTSIFVRNRTWCTGIPLDKTPEEMFTGNKPDVSHFVPIGAEAWVRIYPDEAFHKNLGKFGPKAERCIVLGYGDDEGMKNTYKIKTESNRYLYRGDVKVNEADALEENMIPSEDLDDLNIKRDSLEDSDEDESKVNQSSSPLDELEPHETTAYDSIREFISTPRTTDIPPTPPLPKIYVQENTPLPPCPLNYKDALRESNQYRMYWMEAVMEELRQFYEREIFQDIPPSELKNLKATFDSKFAFRVTRDMDGYVKFKARLVARGFREIFGVHYDKSFSPTVHYENIRLIQHIATIQGWYIRQIDIGNAYLEADPDRRLFMELPKDWAQGKVIIVELIKNIYGLKQAGLMWYILINRILIEYGFRRTIHDPCVYVKDISETNPDLIILTMFVDDQMIAGNNKKVTDDFVNYLNSKFRKITDFGAMKKYVGVNSQLDLASNHLKSSMRDVLTTYIESHQISKLARTKHVSMFPQYKSVYQCFMVSQDEEYLKTREVRQTKQMNLNPADDIDVSPMTVDRNSSRNRLDSSERTYEDERENQSSSIEPSSPAYQPDLYEDLEDTFSTDIFPCEYATMIDDYKLETTMINDYMNTHRRYDDLLLHPMARSKYHSRLDARVIRPSPSPHESDQMQEGILKLNRNLINYENTMMHMTLGELESIKRKEIKSHKKMSIHKVIKMSNIFLENQKYLKQEASNFGSVLRLVFIPDDIAGKLIFGDAYSSAFWIAERLINRLRDLVDCHEDKINEILNPLSNQDEYTDLYSAMLEIISLREIRIKLRFHCSIMLFEGSFEWRTMMDIMNYHCIPSDPHYDRIMNERYSGGRVENSREEYKKLYHYTMQVPRPEWGAMSKDELMQVQIKIHKSVDKMIRLLAESGEVNNITLENRMNELSKSLCDGPYNNMTNRITASLLPSYAFHEIGRIEYYIKTNAGIGIDLTYRPKCHDRKPSTMPLCQYKAHNRLIQEYACIISKKDNVMMDKCRMKCLYNIKDIKTIIDSKIKCKSDLSPVNSAINRLNHEYPMINVNDLGEMYTINPFVRPEKTNVDDEKLEEMSLSPPTINTKDCDYPKPNKTRRDKREIILFSDKPRYDKYSEFFPTRKESGRNQDPQRWKLNERKNRSPPIYNDYDDEDSHHVSKAVRTNAQEKEDGDEVEESEGGY